jgi:hypothetical protein
MIDARSTRDRHVNGWRRRAVEPTLQTTATLR